MLFILRITLILFLIDQKTNGFDKTSTIWSVVIVPRYHLISNTMPENVKLPPLLCMTVNKAHPSRSEYRFSFTPKVKLVQPHIKLASSFMYRRPPEYVRGQPRLSFQPGYVPAARSGGLGDYVFLHSNAFYNGTKEERTYFTVRPDWVSERSVRKNNPFSWRQRGLSLSPIFLIINRLIQ